MGITMCPGPLHHPGTRMEDRGEVGGARLDLARNVFCPAGIQADTRWFCQLFLSGPGGGSTCQKGQSGSS